MFTLPMPALYLAHAVAARRTDKDGDYHRAVAFWTEQNERHGYVNVLAATDDALAVRVRWIDYDYTDSPVFPDWRAYSPLPKGLKYKGCVEATAEDTLRGDMVLRTPDKDTLVHVIYESGAVEIPPVRRMFNSIDTIRREPAHMGALMLQKFMPYMTLSKYGFAEILGKRALTDTVWVVDWLARRVMHITMLPEVPVRKRHELGIDRLQVDYYIAPVCLPNTSGYATDDLPTDTELGLLTHFENLKPREVVQAERQAEYERSIMWNPAFNK